MCNRYQVAKALGHDAYEQAVNEDAELLKLFGLQLLSVDQGIRAAVESEIRGNRINPWNIVSFDAKAWAWLRPQLLLLSKAKAKAKNAV